MSGRTPLSRSRLPSSPPCLALHDRPQSQGTSGAAELLQRRARGREHAHVAARACAQRSAPKNFSPMPHAGHIRRLSSSLRTRLPLTLQLPLTSTTTGTGSLAPASLLALVATAVLVSGSRPPPARRRSPAHSAAVPLPVAPRTKPPAAPLQEAATLAWSRSAALTRTTLLRILRPGHGEVSAPCRSSLGAELLTPRRGASFSVDYGSRPAASIMPGARQRSRGSGAILGPGAHRLRHATEVSDRQWSTDNSPKWSTGSEDLLVNDGDVDCGRC